MKTTYKKIVNGRVTTFHRRRTLFEWIKDNWIAIVITVIIAISIIIVDIYVYPHISDCPSGMCNLTME